MFYVNARSYQKIWLIKGLQVLLLGGTRFVGKALGELLVSRGHAVTVASRRSGGCPPGAQLISGERDETLLQLAGEKFDLVLDFTSNPRSGPERVCSAVRSRTYILISSTWVTRMSANVSADEIVSSAFGSPPAKMLPVTYNYLCNKLEAEKEVSRLRAAGGKTYAVRLPIMWGKNDHTGRLSFYRSRIQDEGKVIAVDGGRNLVQVAWSTDVVQALADWIESGIECDNVILEALPHDGICLSSMVEKIAANLNRDVELYRCDHALLDQRVPEYLEVEPLWRETPLPRTPHNLFALTGTKPRPIDHWLSEIPWNAERPESDGMRRKELEIITELTAVR